MSNQQPKEVRKAQVLEAVDILTYIQGYPPSYRDLAQAIGIAHSGVYLLVQALRADGLIHEPMERRSRAITLTSAGKSAVSRRTKE